MSLVSDYQPPAKNATYNSRKVTATNGHTRVSPVYITDNTPKNQQYYETHKIQNVSLLINLVWVF